MNTTYRTPLPGSALDYFDARAAVEDIQPGAWDALPYTSRVLAENLVRRCDPALLTDALKQLVERKRDLDFPWYPARVVCHDILGQTALVDLAGLRDAIAAQGGDPAKINPVVPVQLVVDHSLAVECGGFDPDAFTKNRAIEDRRNEDRFDFINWTKLAFKNVDVIPAGNGIMSDRDVFVVSAVRTAIGTFGGSLKDVPPSALATTAIKAAIERAAVPADQVGHVVMGTVIPTEPRDAYLSRVAAMDAGIPKETPAFNVNRLCGSGLQSIVSAAQTLLLGDAEVAIGAGAESMSRGAYLLPGARWGVRMGDAPIVDFVTGALHDPFGRMHMGVTAENVAAKHGITREMQDELAAESHRRAARAVAEGRFAGQIVPVDVPSRKGPVQFSVDEHFRADTSVEQLAKMKPVFKKDGGSVTAGNASGLNDGAGAVM